MIDVFTDIKRVWDLTANAATLKTPMGELYRDLMPEGTAMPYCRMLQIPGDSLQRTFGNTLYIERAAVQFDVFSNDAADPDLALRLIEAVAGVYDKLLSLTLTSPAQSLALMRRYEPRCFQEGQDERGSNVHHAFICYDLHNQRIF